MGDMAYFAKFSAKLYLNEKVAELAEVYPRAVVLWVLAITYCVDNHTDGVFTGFAARRFLNAQDADLQALVEAGFLDNIDENEYLIHDYDQAQVTTAKRDDLRAKRAAAGRKGMASRWKNTPYSEPPTEGGEPDEPITSVITNDNKPITSVITNGYQNITDIDIDKDIDNIYINNNNTNNVIKGDDQENQTPDPTPDPTPEHKFEELTVSSQTLSASNTQTVERITQQLRGIYPAERYDADSTHCQFMLENAIPRISKAAGTQDPATWFTNRTRAYIEATERRYVKKFSRYIDQQIYLQDWEQAIPQSAKPVNRSQAGLQANLNLIKQYEAMEGLTHA